MKTLHLTLSKSPFEVMKTGEKESEIRKPSDWIKSRLYHKDGTRKNYDQVKFVNGYGTDKPNFTNDYLSFEISDKSYQMTYSNGLTVEVEKGDFIINTRHN